MAIVYSSPVLAEESDVIDLSSPKAALEGFFESSDELIEHWRNETLDSQAGMKAYFQSAKVLDLSLVPNRSRQVVVMERIILLREILDRITGLDISALPDAQMVTENEISHWRVANTDLVLVKQTEGDLKGLFLFSETSVQKLSYWYHFIHNLPYVVSDRENYYDEFLVSPGPLLSRDFILSLDEKYHRIALSLPVWQWIALGLMALVSWGFLRFVSYIATSWNAWKAQTTERIGWRIGHIIALMSAALWLLLLRTIIDDGIWLSGVVYQTLAILFLIVQFVLIGWLVMALINHAALLFAHRKSTTEHIDTSLITVLARIFGVIVVILIGLYGIEFMGYSISPLLAGLGVGGLALALAVRPLLENVINGLTLYADGGIKTGDLCRYGDNLGVIENIGLRSTRIRTLERSVITIPNSELANIEIDNLDRRDKRRMDHTLMLRPELSMGQLKVLLVNLRRIFLQHPKVEEEPVRVRFLGVGSYALEIGIVIYIRSKVHDEFLSIQEELLFAVLEQVDLVGAKLAYANQRQSAGDVEAIEQDKKEKADETVAQWVEAENYPFPDFSYEYKYEIKDSSIYPHRSASIRKDATNTLG
ncbi:mechanosensitive ion channel family protein [Corallincola luteus]|uniref:Mechanosensitive ion channel family protein n=1 Tax=Corallincola luteus TaxID=1775177 RepID=A0ABY2AIC2_9GAMM|nr:mechanosensitive ion channel family protein [Corallincola luteus]TCI02430.1 mechanosensitive ion channel family protein [Corallincola luteus]